MSRPAALAIAAALAAPAASAATPGLPVYADFKDWTVACDVVGDCEARGFSSYDVPGLWLRFTRAAGRAALPRLEIHGLSGSPRAGAMLFDGRLVALGEGWTSRAAPDAGPGAYVLETGGLTAQRRFLQEAKRASTLGFPGGEDVGSLAGFNAAMLLVDDAQDRVDSPSALARPGTRAPAPGWPRALPIVQARPWAGPQPDVGEARRYLRALSGPFDECDDPQAREGSVHAISADEVLAMVECWRGAYRAGQLVLRGPRRDPAAARPVRLPPAPHPEQREFGPMVTAADYDPARARLTGYAKGRGLGDCGESVEWVFDGAEFQLADYRLLDRCGWMQAGDFLTLWRSRVQGEARR